MTGAPGAAYGVRLLEDLRALGVETHLVYCGCALRTLREEAGRDRRSLRGLAHRVYGPDNQAARISSGSYLTDGMIVAPCSMRAAAAIGLGLAGNLIHRAADVTIKEGRRLVLLLSEPAASSLDTRVVERASRVGAVLVDPEADGEEGGLERTVGRLLGAFALRPP